MEFYFKWFAIGLNIKGSIHDIKRKKINFKSIQQEMNENKKSFDDLKDIIKIFDSNCKKVKNTISLIMEESTNDNDNNTGSKLLGSISFSPTEMEKCREEQINIHLKKLKEINKSFDDSLFDISSIQEAMLNEFTNNLTEITRLSILISSESKTMDAYKIALNRKDQLFFEFVKLKALPNAYNACIQEVVRRKVFGSLINDEINNHLLNIFTNFRNSEILKRKNFINEYGMLPVDLIDGLTNMPGNIKISYNYSNEQSLPDINDDIKNIEDALYKEFKQSIKDYAFNNDECAWIWKGEEQNNDDNKQKNGYHKKNNNIDLLKEETKWKTEKLQLEVEYESKLNELESKLIKLQSKNQDLEIELEQYKREEFPDPPNLSQQDSSALSQTGFDADYIASQLSTILGASISNINPSALEQSRMFLSKIHSSNNNSTNLLATNEVLQSDINKLKEEIISKDKIIKKLSIENDKLSKQNIEFGINLDKLKESSNNLRIEMEEILNKHKFELENIEIEENKKLDEITELNDNISKLKIGRRDLLSQIKILSDVNEEWEERYNKINNEYNLYRTDSEQKDNDDWMTMSYLTNENDERKQEIKYIKNNSIWLNGDKTKINNNDDNLTGYNLLFIRDKDASSYIAILDTCSIPVILDEQGIRDNLKQLSYPRLLSGEIFQIIQRTMPQNIGKFKKGDPVFIVTAGCLKKINFAFS